MSKRVAAAAGIAVAFGLTAVAAVALWPGGGDVDTSGDAPGGAPAASGSSLESTGVEDPAGTGGFGLETNGHSQPGADSELLAELTGYAVEPAPSPLPVQIEIKKPPAAGLLFDVDSGEVLWARRPAAELPIASLTKMMTALLIAERHGPNERAMIDAKAAGVEGSQIGALIAGKRVPLRGAFLGLIMASGNDAAVALAQHDAGTIQAFVRRMNGRAAAMGLGCTRFAGPAGLQDRGNHSCAYDLAALARADLADPWIASVTRRPYAKVPFPIKGGTLHLANNHFFVQQGVAGLPRARVTGVKTGLTNGAGRCYVTTARLGGTHLGVVLLDSPDPLKHVPRLLAAGFAASRNG
jgi:serine-type D-Ala-D-Ala carboxypeptidase (penicillin-binding protein 5/6)